MLYETKTGNPILDMLNYTNENKQSLLYDIAYSLTKQKPDTDLIEKFMHKTITELRFLENKNDQWNPILDFIYNMETEEEYHFVFGVAKPLLNHMDSIKRIKECKHCNNFFIAISLKAIYCSVKCRAAFHYKKK